MNGYHIKIWIYMISLLVTTFVLWACVWKKKEYQMCTQIMTFEILVLTTKKKERTEKEKEN